MSHKDLDLQSADLKWLDHYCRDADDAYHAAVGRALAELESARREVRNKLYSWMGDTLVVASGYSPRHRNALGNWGNLPEYVTHVEGVITDYGVSTDNGVIQAWLAIRVTRGFGHGRHYRGEPHPLELDEYQIDLRKSRFSRLPKVSEVSEATAG